MIVELNPGYLQLIAQYPQVASLLRNPKVKIITDDGRRWLLANPHQAFDAIVMNASFNWREHESNLLSVEFLNIARAHLCPGGVLYYNTTSSPEVLDHRRYRISLRAQGGELCCSERRAGLK